MISLISMRVTLMPQGDDRGIDHAQEPLVDLVAMRQIWSRSMPPMTERILVIVSLMMAESRLVIS